MDGDGRADGDKYGRRRRWKWMEMMDGEWRRRQWWSETMMASMDEDRIGNGRADSNDHGWQR